MIVQKKIRMINVIVNYDTMDKWISYILLHIKRPCQTIKSW